MSGFVMGTASFMGEATGNLLSKVGIVNRGRRLNSNRVDGQTIVITGGNRGIGKEVVKELARRGGRLILGIRDPNLGKETVDSIKNELSSANVQIILHKLDLSSIESIHYFANLVLETESHIDVLINNAGVWATSKRITADGFEENFAVNHLGHFLLTLLFLERMKKSPSARIINVGSITHNFAAKIDFNDINYNNKKYSFLESYGVSKLAVVTSSIEMARRLPPNVKVYCIDPGYVKTDLFRENPSAFTAPVLSQIYKVSINVSTLFWSRTAAEGAVAIIHCVTANDPAQTSDGHGQGATQNGSGLYFSDCKPKKPNKVALDPEVGKKLWEVSCDMVGLPTFKNKQQL